MTDIFIQILDWVAEHTLWAGVVIFLVAMAESLAIVGLIVPGVVIMFGIGALITAGAIPFWPAMGWAVAGAVTGDGLSFWLGRHYSDRLRQLWPFNKHPQSLNRGIDFFQKYGGKSVVFGRFFGPVRAVIPLVAGMMGMSISRFLLANVFSALVWAPAYLLPGMVFGASLELASEVAFRLVAILVLLAILIWFTLWLLKRLFVWIQPRSAKITQRLLDWSDLHPRLGTVSAALADPNHPEAKALSLLATLLILTAALFGLVFGAVIQDGVLAIDQTSHAALQSLRSPWGDHLMVLLTRQADTWVVVALTLGMLGFFLIKRHFRTALYWLAAFLFATLTPWLLKLAVAIPRPETAAQIESYAFPSGHTMAAVVLYGFLAVIIAWSMPVRWRWLPYGVAGFIVLCVGVSRIYLGAHWLTDVLGSLALGITWVALLGLAYRHHSVPESHWRKPTAVAVSIYLLVMVAVSQVQHQEKYNLYVAEPETVELDSAIWWQGSTDKLPERRADTRAQLNHPLNIQYAGQLDALQAELAQQGWQPARVLTWKNSLRLLSTKLSLQELPVLPQVHRGKHESLILEKLTPDGGREVLRLWPTHIRLKPNDQPLWIGNVSLQQREELLGVLAYAKTSMNFEEPLIELSKDLVQNGKWNLRLNDGRLLLKP